MKKPNNKMKKIFNLLFIGIGLAATSCSEMPEYELPYELSPTAEVALTVDVTPSNAICEGPALTFAGDSNTTVYYAIQPTADDALDSDTVFDDGDDISLAGDGSETINLAGLELEESYTVYAVTVNEDGTRSEEVTTANFTMPSFEEVADVNLTEDYVGTVSYNGTPFEQFDVTLTNDGSYVFSADTLWGDAIAGLTGRAEYAGAFQYPGTITLGEDFAVTVDSEWAFAMGGDGEYDPCTGVFSYELVTSIFDDPETEAVEPLSVTVELMPATE